MAAFLVGSGAACKAESPAPANRPDAPQGVVAVVEALPGTDRQGELAGSDGAPDPDGASAAQSEASGGATLANAGPHPDDRMEPETDGLGDPPAPEATTGPYRVLILGDSLAATGFGALLERKLDAHPDVVCYRKGKSASGLARPDFFDWMAEAHRQVELRQPQVVVVIMGGNDGQDLTAKRRGKRVRWQHEDWETEYRERMDAFLGEVTGPSRKVLWLGLPTMGLRSLEKKLLVIRKIQQEAVAAVGDGSIYLDTAPYVTEEGGELLTHAQVGGRGKSQQIRAEDRIHFTMSGSEYFADAVYPEVLQVLGLELALADGANE
jgi:hypothetical protein